MDVAQARAVLTLDDTQYQREIKKAGQAFDQMGKDVEAAGKRAAGNVGAALSTLGTRFSIGVTAPLAALGVASVRSATQMDSLKRGLTAVAGSSAEAERQLVRLEEIAKLPGLGRVEAIQASTQLQAAGLSAKTAERSLLAFGNALATVGKGKAELDGVTLALTQITAKGKVTAEEINQIAERVPQIRKVMLAAFGTANTESLQKMGLTAQQFIEGVNNELLKLPRVTGGAQNAFENLQDSIQKALTTIGQQLLPTVLPIVTRLTERAVELAEAFGRLPAPVRQAVVVMAALAAATGPALLVTGQLIGSFKAMQAVLPGATGRLRDLGQLLLAAPGWTKVVVLAVGAMGAAWSSDLFGMQTRTRQFVDDALVVFKELWDTALFYVNNFLVGMQTAFEGIKVMLTESFLTPVQTAMSQLLQVFAVPLDAIGDLLEGLGTKFAAVLKAAGPLMPGLAGGAALIEGVIGGAQTMHQLADMLRMRDSIMEAAAGGQKAAPDLSPVDIGPYAGTKKKTKQRADTPYEQQWKAYHQALNAANRELDLLDQNATDTAISVANQYSLIDNARRDTLTGKLEEIKSIRDANQLWSQYRQELRSAQTALDMAAVSGDKLAELRLRFSRRDEQGRVIEQIVSDADLKRLLEAQVAIDKLQKAAQGWQQYNQLQFQQGIFKSTKQGAFVFTPAQREAMQLFNKELKDLSENELAAGANALKLNRLLNANQEVARYDEQQQQDLISARSRAAIALLDSRKSFEAFASGNQVAQVALEQFGVRLKDLPQIARNAVSQTIKELLQIDQARKMLEMFSEGIKSTFTDAFLSLQDGFGGFFKSIIDGFKQMLARMAAEYLSSQLVSLFMHAFGNVLGGFFGGGKPAGRQHGGYVGAGKPYMVGERGPELFLPRNSGTIVPAGAGAGGGNITINMTVHATDAQSFRNDRSIMSDMWNEARRAQRRDGS